MTDDGQVEALQKMVGAVRVDPLVLDYLMAIIQASRSHPDITLGWYTGALELRKRAELGHLSVAATTFFSTMSNISPGQFLLIESSYLVNGMR